MADTSDLRPMSAGLFGYDSDPQDKFEETQNKAMALVRAAADALRFSRAERAVCAAGAIRRCTGAEFH